MFGVTRCRVEEQRRVEGDRRGAGDLICQAEGARPGIMLVKRCLRGLIMMIGVMGRRVDVRMRPMIRDGNRVRAARNSRSMARFGVESR